ncbi:MAG: AMP-binding protein [Acetobacter sp.]|nr:AMP-binding protein [Bacteroides sp.]MCM1341182.1 AMP-binding protein [Acetobacter sp.]MCM1433825.1 AMP-binding protein [Clostridiales bacterium]
MKNILEFFEKTTEKYPDKTAFTDRGREESFTGAMKNAKAIATGLLKEGTKKPVAILIDKTVNCIDAMLGALYAGDFYVVIDVHSPLDRIENIINTLENPIIITDNASIELADSLGKSFYVYDTIKDTDIDEDKLADIRRKMIDRDTAYILFTSGSTGTPKGTIISHRALISYVNWVTNEFQFDNNTSFGSQTPLYFSMSVTDFYSTIKCGCTYNIIPKEYFSFPLKLIEFLNEKKINTIYWVPTAISILSNWKAFDVMLPEYLKTVLFAGEVMPTKQLNYWIDKLDSDVTFANLFGPTETTDICTFYVVNRAFADDDSLPIGKACDNCQVFIVKDNGEEAENGEEGELYVRSTFMADGYFANPEKTAQAFVQNPLNDKYPDFVYKTGDIVKYNELGELIYISRKDFQIKRMGYRIELGEIEAGANSVEKVKACACIYDKNNDCLALIYEGRGRDAELIREAVKSKVPAYMMPDKFLRIKEMPKNANGKIDRKALLGIYKDLD